MSLSALLALPLLDIPSQPVSFLSSRSFFDIIHLT
jgi:hypothetical protein